MQPDFGIIGIFAGRMVLSLLLGTLIGFEREFFQKSAGLRTHILVTFGSTLFTIVSLSDFYQGLPDIVPASASAAATFQRDPARVAAQIVSGIGFLGGGAIIKYGASIRGLTTAASVWNAASIGMLVGTGHYMLAIIAAILSVIILFAIGRFERNFFHKASKSLSRLMVDISINSEKAPATMAWMDERFRKEIIQVRCRDDVVNKRMDLHYILNYQQSNIHLHDIATNISRHEGIENVIVKTYEEVED